MVHSLRENLEAGLMIRNCVCSSCGFSLTDTGCHAHVVGNSHMCNCGKCADCEGVVNPLAKKGLSLGEKGKL